MLKKEAVADEAMKEGREEERDAMHMHACMQATNQPTKEWQEERTGSRKDRTTESRADSKVAARARKEDLSSFFASAAASSLFVPRARDSVAPCVPPARPPSSSSSPSSRVRPSRTQREVGAVYPLGAQVSK